MPSVDERLAKYIDKTPTCWLWTGGKTSLGYGKFHYQGRTVLAHRFVYEQYVGPIPSGLTLDHLCCVKACVRPDHLEPVTSKENKQRWARTITHCPEGHEYTPENTIINNGSRVCRSCNRTAALARYHRKASTSRGSHDHAKSKEDRRKPRS